VTIEGWVDPRPAGGQDNAMSASGVKKFRLQVHAMVVERGQVTMRVSECVFFQFIQLYRLGLLSL
jgi:hypothetical protein